MKKKNALKYFSLFMTFLSFSAFAQVEKVEFNQFFEIDRGHSYIEFSVKYMGYAKVRGRFAQFSGLVRYDKNSLFNTSVSLLIKPESITTDLEFRDNDLKSENWLDAKKFPSIIFTSKAVKKTGDGFELTGDLMLKGTTREIVLHMAPPSGILKDVRADLQVIFTGTASIDRTQFGIEGKNWSGIKEGITAVENEITIEVSILGKQFQVANFANRVRNTQNPPGKIYKIIQDQGVQQGIEEFKKMLATNSVKLPALDNVGYMLRLEGKYADAIAVYEANRDAFPESTDVYYSLGEVYLMQGDQVKAKSYFMEALRKDPANINATEYVRHLK